MGVGLVVPGWWALTLVRPKDLSLALALPTSVGLSLSVVSIAAWLGWATHAGMRGDVLLTALTVLCLAGARLALRRHGYQRPKPTRADLGPGLLALGFLIFALADGQWLSQTADVFYHLAGTRSLLVTQSSLPQEIFFGVQVPYPDASSGSVKWNCDPWPSSLSTQILPPCISTIWRVMARPSPVPMILLLLFS